MSETFSDSQALKTGQAVLQTESRAIAALADKLDASFIKAVDLILNCEGRIVVSGVGKSGHVAKKMAATFASTGSPAFFVHAGEAAHGDLGMITGKDVMIAVSNSGTTSELLTIVPILKREGTPLIAITGNASSALANYADVHLDTHVAHEADSLDLAPTTSTTVTLALGDALAVACLNARGFSKEDFARSHPGGALGRRLLIHVRDVMRTGDALPVVQSGMSVLDAVREITRKHIGMTAIVDAQNVLLGIFTEGDLRRLIEKNGDIRNLRIDDVMTREPKTVDKDALAAQAARVLDESLCNQLLVIDDKRRLIGALHVHDLMTAKVI